MPATQIEGQLNAIELRLLTEAVTQCAEKPKVAIEVGTWLGGGGTLHILEALEKNGAGHLWGIEAERSVYDQMLANLRTAASLRSAKARLFRQQCNPVEIAATVLPANVCLFFLRLMPRRFSRRVAEGRTE